ncbi:MAG: carboxypeptidase-like regulatory domain-containing protein [Acidobacteriota bacterium]|nr:carboxypeptidase-like regulatory domain-containing protein [Acidobacteriota bacterium]
MRARQAGKDGGERRIPVEGSGLVTTTLPAATTWDITGEVPGYWVHRETLTIGPAPQPVTARLRLWPLGHIAGTVKAGRGTALPKGVTVITLPGHGPETARSAPKGSLDCPITMDGKDGRFSCEMPAARFDLSIEAKGFIPLYRFDVEVAPAKTVHVGSYELRRGASVAGWVEVRDGAPAPGHCRVRLSPLIVQGGAPAAERIRRTAVETPVSERGFFQLAGIRPGSYALSVEQPGWAPARLSPVEVTEEGETLLRDPLVLSRPFTIELAVTPPTDWRGRPWRLELLRVRDPSSRLQAERVHEGPVGQDGIALVHGQEPGRFSVRVGDSIGNWLYSEDNLKFDGAEKVRHDISLHLLTLRGTLSLGREPLAGEVWFGGRHGKTAVRMEADARGRFAGFLARGGMWDLEVLAGGGRISDVRRVQVEADRQGRAKLDVTLPATHVFGRVVFDENDRPAGGATVALIASAQSSIETTADDQGAFEFRGVAEGPVDLTAAVLEQPRYSNRISVTTIADRSVGPVELRLGKSKMLSGRVGSPRGPVAGGSVYVLTLRPPGVFTGPAATDLEGAWSVPVPSGTEAALAIVSAPGNGLKAFEISPEQGEAYLEVSPETGVLRIKVEMSAADLEKKALALEMFQDGHSVPMSVLYRWARINGAPPLLVGGPRTLEVPALAPGLYQVCLQPLPRPGSPGMPASVSVGTCKQGFLGAGAVLDLPVGL